MIRLKMKKYNKMLIEKLRKLQSYHQAKLISITILQVKKTSPSNQNKQKQAKQAKLIEPAKQNKLNLLILL